MGGRWAGGGQRMLRLATGWAAAEYSPRRSRESGLWVAATAFDAGVMRHHKDPGVGVWEGLRLNLVRPCI